MDVLLGDEVVMDVMCDRGVVLCVCGREGVWVARGDPQGVETETELATD